MRYRNLLFDLDGTLTDPAEGITRSVAYALEKFGIIETDMQRLYCFIGPPLDDSFREFYGFSSSDAHLALQYYRERFASYGWRENTVYPNIEQMLQSVCKQGMRAMLATSKPTPFAIRILQHFRLISYFDFIGGSGMNGERHDKADVIDYVLSECNITDLSRTVMIGDRKHDIIGAKETGIASIGVLYGYGDRKELEEAGATSIAASVEELEQLLCE